MAEVQKYFEQFHQAIRADYESDEKLREKRDIVLDKIVKFLRDAARPSFDVLHQGSYSKDARTGVKTIENLRYDIDIGLRFAIEETEYTAKEVRGWVWEAVKDHTGDVQDKGPCIRVIYAEGFHLDLVSYARWTDDAGREQYRLAHKENGWRPTDPPELLKCIKDAREPFSQLTDSATSTDQFRRVVRYLKRWYDEQIPEESSDKPTGLGYTLLCRERLQPMAKWDGSPDDRKALEQLASWVEVQLGRIAMMKPTPEYEDLFGKLSDSAMDKLKSRFGDMKSALVDADAEPDPVKACERLALVFGRDFPVPKPSDTGRKTSAPAIVTSSYSA
jgi:hypothetical protein